MSHAKGALDELIPPSWPKWPVEERPLRLVPTTTQASRQTLGGYPYRSGSCRILVEGLLGSIEAVLTFWLRKLLCRVLRQAGYRFQNIIMCFTPLGWS